MARFIPITSSDGARMTVNTDRIAFLQYNEDGGLLRLDSFDIPLDRAEADRINGLLLSDTVAGDLKTLERLLSGFGRSVSEFSRSVNTMPTSVRVRH